MLLLFHQQWAAALGLANSETNNSYPANDNHY